MFGFALKKVFEIAVEEDFKKSVRIYTPELKP